MRNRGLCLLGTRRLFDVLSLAGGTSAKAGEVVSVTHRDHPGAPVSIMLSNDPAESAKNNIGILPATPYWYRGPGWCTWSVTFTGRVA